MRLDEVQTGIDSQEAILGSKYAENANAGIAWAYEHCFVYDLEEVLKKGQKVADVIAPKDTEMGDLEIKQILPLTWLYEGKKVLRIVEYEIEQDGKTEKARSLEVWFLHTDGKWWRESDTIVYPPTA